jgi:hypothetical protein
MRRAVLTAALSLGALALLAPAAGAKPPLCTAGALQQALIDAGKLTQQDIDGGEVVDLIRCGDMTDDGDADALFTIASGGTAGDIRFGVFQGRADGTARRLVLYRQGYKVGISRRTRRAFEVIQPHYKPGEPNCCPSSFRIRRYTWTGHHFKAAHSVKKRKTAPRRFYRP